MERQLNRSLGGTARQSVAWWALSAGDREVLALVAFDGLTSDQAATVLGCRRSAFGMRLGRATKAARPARSGSSSTPPPAATRTVRTRWPERSPERCTQVRHAFSLAPPTTPFPAEPPTTAPATGSNTNTCRKSHGEWFGKSMRETGGKHAFLPFNTVAGTIQRPGKAVCALAGQDAVRRP